MAQSTSTVQLIEAVTRAASGAGASRQIVAAAVAAAIRAAAETEASGRLQHRASTSPRGDTAQLFKLIKLLEARVAIVEEAAQSNANHEVHSGEEQSSDPGPAGDASSSEPMPEPIIARGVQSNVSLQVISGPFLIRMNKEHNFYHKTIMLVPGCDIPA